MQFADNPRSEVIQFRATSAEVAFLKNEAARRGTTTAALVREALDQWLANHPRSRAASDSGSRKAPSAVKAKVKAASKRSPSSSQGTVQ